MNTGPANGTVVNSELLLASLTAPPDPAQGTSARKGPDPDKGTSTRKEPS